jgi:hypothetical protein
MTILDKLETLFESSLSLSFAITQLILHGYTIAEVITLEFSYSITERRPQRHLISPTAGAAAAIAPSSFMENFYREFILLDLQHYYIGPAINRENWGEIIAGTVQPTEQLLTYLPR